MRDGHKAKPEGSGLELVYYQKLVTMAKGEIAVYSDESIGSRFVIHFPDVHLPNVGDFRNFEHI